MRRIFTTVSTLKWVLLSDRGSVRYRQISKTEKSWEIPDKRRAFSGMTLLGWIPLAQRIGLSHAMTVGDSPVVWARDARWPWS